LSANAASCAGFGGPNRCGFEKQIGPYVFVGVGEGFRVDRIRIAIVVDDPISGFAKLGGAPLLRRKTIGFEV